MSRWSLRACSNGSSMPSPIDNAPASRAPRLAASITPGRPPVMTAIPSSPIMRAVSRARAYSGSSGGVRAEPKKDAAAPTCASARKPSSSSSRMRSIRAASVRVERSASSSAPISSSSRVSGTRGWGSVLDIEHPSLATLARGPGYPGSAEYDAPMRRLACLVGFFVLAGPASWGADAGAEPRALLDSPRARGVAVAGAEVLVAAGTSRGGVRLSAVPAVGGPVRVVLEVPPRGRGWTSVLRLASSAQLTALLVAHLDPNGNFRDWRVYAGPPAGPLALVQRVRRTVRGGTWTPLDVDVHGDRLLVQELRQPRFAFRLVVRAPDGTAPPVPQGRFGMPTAVAGDLLAYAGTSGRADGRAFIRLIDWRTGRLSSSLELGRPSEDIEDRHLDLTDGGRVVAAIDGRLITGAPGVPVQELPGSGGVAGLTSPRFAGERVAALAPARRGARRPVVIDPAVGTLQTVGPISSELTAIAANEATVAWLANGCLLAADASPVAAPPSAAPGQGSPPGAMSAQTLDAPPPGPCPRAEVDLGEAGDRVRGRVLRVPVICVAAPPPGCSGEGLLGKGGWAGRGRFQVPPGERRSVRVRLSRRGIAQVRRHLRLYPVADFSMTARVEDGRLVPYRQGSHRGVTIKRLG